MGKDLGAQGSFNQFPQGTHNVPGCPQKDCRSPESALGKVARRKEGLDSRSIALATRRYSNNSSELLPTPRLSPSSVPCCSPPLSLSSAISRQLLDRLHLSPQQSRLARSVQICHAVVGPGRLPAVLVSAARGLWLRVASALQDRSAPFRLRLGCDRRSAGFLFAVAEFRRAIFAARSATSRIASARQKSVKLIRQPNLESWLEKNPRRSRSTRSMALPR
jgi:hypothetical protein